MATESDKSKAPQDEDELLDEMSDDGDDAEDDNDAEDDGADDGDAEDDDADADDGDADDEDDDADADDDDADDDDADSDDADDDADSDDADDDDGADDDGPSAKTATAAMATGAAAAGTSGRRGSRARRRRKKKKSSPNRNIILFVLLVAGITGLFALLGTQGGGGTPTAQPKWKIGQTVDVEITIVTTDYKNLACAMSTEISGKHCAFESQNKKFAGKSDNSRENANLLQPYTSVDNVQFMASGLWMEPALKAKLDKENWNSPSPRFTVNCKYKVEGKTTNASIRWKPGIGWNSGNNWWTGSVSTCKIGK